MNYNEIQIAECVIKNMLNLFFLIYKIINIVLKIFENKKNLIINSWVRYPYIIF